MGIGQAVSAKIVYLKPERMHARTGMVARAPRVHASEIACVRTASVNARPPSLRESKSLRAGSPRSRVFRDR